MKYKEIHFETIDSTNTYAKNHYLSLDNFTFISTDYQEKGKGRNERTWKSNRGDNLLFSLLIKDKTLVSMGGYLSLVSSVSVSQALERYGFKDVTIKWPNDINIGDKKVCGILLEGQISEYLVIGIGINVNQKGFDGEYNVAPTSLFLEGQKKIDLSQFKRDMFDILISNLKNIGSLKDSFIAYFDNHNYLKNKAINFVYGDKEMTGSVIGTSNDFSLLVDTKNEVVKVTSGEIHIKSVN